MVVTGDRTKVVNRTPIAQRYHELLNSSSNTNEEFSDHYEFENTGKKTKQYFYIFARKRERKTFLNL